jgi:formylglycine-generating enzyme required for sulfatase activity/predicted esterase
MTLARGMRLGPYEILSPLGSGGMGELYRARDTRLERTVAIKVLPQSLLADPVALARFEREAKSIAALSHPNILAIHDFGTHEGVAFAVMELLEGETLRDKLDAGPIPLTLALDYASQVARGLSAAHEKAIIHRDLKPENLFVARDSHVKILDFGLAKRVVAVAPGEETSARKVSGLTKPGTVMGTLSYMSPEQLRGLFVDHRSDIFSFGVVLYEMVTGQLPFKGNVLHAELGDFGDKSLPGKLKAIVRKLLEKDPAERYASAEEVHAELKALEASLAPTTTARLSRNSRITIAAAVVMAAAMAGWLWHRSSRVRWALETATPEVARLVAAEEFSKAATLAREARVVLPKDPALKKLWEEATREVSVESYPSDADVLIRPYRGDASSWENLGKTPLQKIRVPRNALRAYVWQIAKPGFATAYRIALESVTPVFRLNPEKKVQPGMVGVPGGNIKLEIPGLDHLPAVPLEDYLIDRNEVTNEQYKKFVDADGYRKSGFWKQPFLKNGRAMPFEQAVALFRDATDRPGPATWEVGSYPKGLENHPVAGVSWYEAAAYAEFAGKTLPTIYHWNRAAQTNAGMLIVPGSNFSGSGTVPVGGAGTLSGFGTTDMAGNVKEWCYNEGRDGRRFILGGGFGDPTYMFPEEDAQSPWDRRPNYGFRCVKLPSPPPAAAATRIVPAFRDFWKEKPVSDEVFKVFKGLYAYDKGELNARVEEKEMTEDWTREKVSFNAAYGSERVIAHLYLPKNATPPFQVVVYFPGSSAIFQDKFTSGESVVWDFVPKSGRALLIPVYKSTFERRDGLKSDYPEPTVFYRDHMIAWSRDLGRSIDYLETRKDVDRTKLAYFGFSWGSDIAPILLAVEKRFRAAILLAGGFLFQQALPEADPINFVTRVKLPVLMVNGSHDNYFPVESSQRPLFRLLGTADGDKHHVIYESGHAVLGNDLIRPSLDWLDRYLGPVKR